MNRLEWANALILFPIGVYVLGRGVLAALYSGSDYLFWVGPFYHTSLTFIIAGIGLIALTLRWRLAAFPLFLIASNIVEFFWMDLNGIGAIQFSLLMFGYVLARPVLKNPLYVPIIVLLNTGQTATGVWPFLDYHHISEASIYLVLLFDVKSVWGKPV